MSEFDATEKARKVFNEDYADSDGDGTAIFSNGRLAQIHLDRTRDITYLNKLSWRTTSRELPLFATKRQNKLPQAFEYHVEQSQDLQTWNKFGLTEESVIELGENMERVTVVTSSAITPGERKFLRLRISTP